MWASHVLSSCIPYLALALGAEMAGFDKQLEHDDTKCESEQISVIYLMCLSTLS